MTGPRIVYETPVFRIVTIHGERIEQVVEVPDGCDALGVERWREFKLNTQTLRAMRDALVAEAEKKRE